MLSAHAYCWAVWSYHRGCRDPKVKRKDSILRFKMSMFEQLACGIIDGDSPAYPLGFSSKPDQLTVIGYHRST